MMQLSIQRLTTKPIHNIWEMVSGDKDTGLRVNTELRKMIPDDQMGSLKKSAAIMLTDTDRSKSCPSTPSSGSPAGSFNKNAGFFGNFSCMVRRKGFSSRDLNIIAPMSS
ncbi:hypothetical protein CAPTEDRAFT_220891 [Capitella teleta]|uniref:Uncharacterized protein n=1 Tax=Capitella teleta TaxID=283909 RepID=R7V6R0_CAPTE|nr:hypothetical protein CAPTEDRAFT_220891 [Capitella teleta]|eukprot:ELU14234.1 hypothetical protein CAPTEDRAFT_220891 [Capitella teleta]